MKNLENELKEIAETFRTYDNWYNLLFIDNKFNKKDCPYCLDNDNIWKRFGLKWMLEYFEEKEEYEKCIILKKLMDEYYIASEEEREKLNKELQIKIF